MNNQRNLYILLATVAVGLIVAFAVFWPREQSFSWRERFSREYEGPYGMHLLYETLKQSAPSSNPLQLLEDTLSKQLPLESEKHNYLFLGGGILLDSVDQDHLLEFIANGNNAMLILETPPLPLLESMFHEPCVEGEWIEYDTFRDTAIQLLLLEGYEMIDQDYQIQKVRKKEILYREWTYLENYFYYCDINDSIEVLGNLAPEFPNFLKIKYGLGQLFLHTTPLAFTNYQFVKPEGKEYAAKVLAHLGDKPIIWDDYNQIEAALARGFNNRSRGSYRKSFETEGPLQYILSQPSLAWAWYLTLAAGLLFILFRAKRAQRIIPVLAENKNNSLEFIQMISRLYFSQNDHRKLALQKMRLWKSHLRDRYQFHLKDQPEPEEIQALAAKTGTSIDLINDIFTKYRSIYRSLQIKDTRLQEFHQLLDSFYKTSK